MADPFVKLENTVKRKMQSDFNQAFDPTGKVRAFARFAKRVQSRRKSRARTRTLAG